jgi:hypothetical protein
MILGGMPSPYELRITFALGLDVTNENAFPLPLVDALVAFTAYPQATGGQRLGAVCLSFCDSNGPCPAAAGACTSGGPGIRTMSDFAGAAAGFLAAVATGQEAVGNLKIRTIAAGSTAHVTVALQLEPMQILALMEQFAGVALDSVKRGQPPRFEIPRRRGHGVGYGRALRQDRRRLRPGAGGVELLARLRRGFRTRCARPQLGGAATLLPPWRPIRGRQPATWSTS